MELLTVIAILAILLALLLPALESAQLGKIRTQIISQLHQIGAASALYANDHDTLLPPGYAPWPHQLRGWTDQYGNIVNLNKDFVTPYLGDWTKAVLCPGALYQWRNPTNSAIYSENESPNDSFGHFFNFNNSQIRSSFNLDLTRMSQAPSNAVLWGTLAIQQTSLYISWDVTQTTALPRSMLADRVDGSLVEVPFAQLNAYAGGGSGNTFFYPNLK